jgi:hypothetical protein
MAMRVQHPAVVAGSFLICDDLSLSGDLEGLAQDEALVCSVQLAARGSS